MQISNQDLFHPKQRLILSLLISSAVKLGFSADYEQSPDVRFTLLYKAKHKNGSYRSVLRQTGIYEKDQEERMISVYSLLTDVTGVMESEKVEWKLEGVNKNFEIDLKRKVDKLLNNIFTATESKILTYLKQGLTSKEIASKLCNSVNTINTHRRNMLKKTDCRNVQELLLFVNTAGM